MTNFIYVGIYFLTLFLFFYSFSKILSICNLDKYIENSKFNNVDGLRSFLALFVVFNHYMNSYNYFTTGEWSSQELALFSLFGSIGVGMFFLITGFLFGFKLFKEKFNIKDFFISRIRRIIPLYIFSVFLVIFVVFYINDFNINQNIQNLVISISTWFSFNFVDFLPINNDNRVFSIQSVYWTLKWEWIFYFSLPMLFFIKTKLFKNKFVFIILLLLVTFLLKLTFVFIFLLGILSAIIHLENIQINKMILNIVGLISIAIVFYKYNSVYASLPSFLLFLFFLSIVISNNLSFLLNLKIVRFFGTISYSIYILHNILLFLVFYIYDKYINKIIEISSLEMWLIGLICLSITTIVSILTYIYIEHKFYRRNIKKQ